MENIHGFPSILYLLVVEGEMLVGYLCNEDRGNLSGNKWMQLLNPLAFSRYMKEDKKRSNTCSFQPFSL